MSPPAPDGPAAGAEVPTGAAEAAVGFQRLVSPKLSERLRDMGIVAPNAIQADAVPLALSGRDLMVVAQTGSGKTLVFLLPILQRLLERPAPLRPCGKPEDASSLASPDCPPSGPVEPEALVLAPTGELAAQVAQVAEQLAPALSSPSAVARLERALAAGRPEATPRLLVGTPEEALDGLRRGTLSTASLRMLAVDEADAVLCGGGERALQVDALLRELEARGEEGAPQLFLTMAHLTQVREDELVRRFPTAQRVGHVGVLVPTLRQCFHYFRSDREAKLLDVLGSAAEDRWLSAGTTLVFCARADSAERVCRLLRKDMPASKAVALYDGLEAGERSAVCEAFRSGAARVLLTTDSAARGLDFPGLRHVVMYDVPSDITAFVHCAGRTARRGQQGLVTCLVQTDEASLYQFDFKSHHGLAPAVQLHFQSAPESLPDKVQEDAVPAKGTGKDVPAAAKSESGRARQPRQKPKERRRDPSDGQPYSFEELRRYYAKQYSEAEIHAYWRRKCTPMLPSH